MKVRWPVGARCCSDLWCWRRSPAGAESAKRCSPSLPGWRPPAWSPSPLASDPNHQWKVTKSAHTFLCHLSFNEWSRSPPPVLSLGYYLLDHFLDEFVGGLQVFGMRAVQQARQHLSKPRRAFKAGANGGESTRGSGRRTSLACRKAPSWPENGWKGFLLSTFLHLQKWHF